MRPLDFDGLDGILLPKPSPVAVQAEYEPTSVFTPDLSEEGMKTELIVQAQPGELLQKPAFGWQHSASSMEPPTAINALVQAPLSPPEIVVRIPQRAALLFAGSFVMAVGALVIGALALAIWVGSRSAQQAAPPQARPAQTAEAPAPEPAQGAPSEPEAWAWEVSFERGSWEAADVALPDWLSRCAAFEIEGYTDATGSIEINQQIGAARAETLRRRLVEAGVDSDRITARHVSRSEALADERSAVVRCTFSHNTESTWSTR